MADLQKKHVGVLALVGDSITWYTWLRKLQGTELAKGEREQRVIANFTRKRKNAARPITEATHRHNVLSERAMTPSQTNKNIGVTQQEIQVISNETNEI